MPIEGIIFGGRRPHGEALPRPGSGGSDGSSVSAILPEVPSTPSPPSSHPGQLASSDVGPPTLLLAPQSLPGLLI